jgi:hypothetical protein
MTVARRAFAAFVLIAGGGAWAAPSALGSRPAPALDPRALSLLHAMSDFLQAQQKFTVHADGSLEVVLTDGERVEYDHDNEVWLKRPNKLRSERRGENVSADFFYDGQTFSLIGAERRYYATAPAPATIDQALDVARDRLGLETAAADLLYSKPYDVLTEDLMTAKYVGDGDIRGVRCHHLAFQGTQTDWQLWIADGPKPVPCRLVITSKKVKGSPQFRTELSQWDFAPEIDDNLFHFTPPPDAKRIEFLGARNTPTNVNVNVKGGER